MKFKVGDKVRYINETTEITHTIDLKIGDILYIKKVDISSIPYLCQDNNYCTNWFREDELELVEEDKKTNSIKDLNQELIEKEKMIEFLNGQLLAYKEILGVKNDRNK